LVHAPNARELYMTADKLAREDDVPMHPGVAAYEAHLMRLMRELPSFERELRRVEANSAGRALTDCALS
jgi:hypothetical protein